MENAEEHRLKRKEQKKAWRAERTSFEQALVKLRQENRKLSQGDTTTVPFAKYDSLWNQFQDCK